MSEINMTYGGREISCEVVKGVLDLLGSSSSSIYISIYIRVESSRSQSRAGSRVEEIVESRRSQSRAGSRVEEIVE